MRSMKNNEAVDIKDGGITVTVERDKITSFEFDVNTMTSVNGLKWSTQCDSNKAKYLCKRPCHYSDVFAHSNGGWINLDHPLVEKWRIIKRSPCECGEREPPNPNPDPRTLPGNGHPTNCNPVVITVFHPELSDSGLYYLGISKDAKDPLFMFWLKVIEPSLIPVEKKTQKTYTGLAKKKMSVIYLNITNLKETMAVETGYQDSNAWLDWVRYSVEQSGQSNCVACAAARPSLATIPFPLNLSNDPAGLQCMYALYTLVSPAGCTSLALLYPVTRIDFIPPHFFAYDGDYECITKTSGAGTQVGHLKWCNSTLRVSHGGMLFGAKMSVMKFARADVWWYCGTNTLYPALPPDWVGTCALIQLVMPFYILPISAEELSGRYSGNELLSRGKRSIPSGSFSSTIYIDSIGVPRGVPDEFKARNEIAAGFESIFVRVTANKNVAWINYLYYNQQRLANNTVDAFTGVHEQLGQTSLMTYQNRIALDMLLAETGGVCKLFGSMCCTFIPNNTAPDGSITKALEGLSALSKELASNSGVKNYFTSSMERWFGQYKMMVLSVLLIIPITIGILILCGCCCIPCIRTLTTKLITTALTKERAEAGQFLMHGEGEFLLEEERQSLQVDVFV